MKRIFYAAMLMNFVCASLSAQENKSASPVAECPELFLAGESCSRHKRPAR